MKRFMTGALVWTFVGTVAYFSITKKEAPRVVHVPKPAAAVVAATTPSQPPAPALLPEVVQVTDLEPLLDPPVRPVGGVPFDPEVVLPATLIPAPALIPPSVD
ncbi:MAG: hypothetical protein K8U57_31875 [Planctomycetes bacterium]|nr:hypothetical protein [Planctomycetota bacterium]